MTLVIVILKGGAIKHWIMNKNIEKTDDNIVIYCDYMYSKINDTIVTIVIE